MSVKIDRDYVLYKLEEKDFMDILHRQIKEGLVGTLRNEYMLTNPMREPYEKYAEQVHTFVPLPIFHAIVDMMTANLLHSTGRKFIDLICDVLEDKSPQQERKIK
jgi:hypothetical protein